MDKNSIFMLLLLLQLMVTFTSTAHHETTNLGAGTAKFFGGLSKPVVENMKPMEESDDHVQSDDKDETGIDMDDFVDVDLDDEDIDQDKILIIGLRDNLEEEIDLMDMDLDKHIGMHHSESMKHKIKISDVIHPDQMKKDKSSKMQQMDIMTPEKKMDLFSTKSHSTLDEMSAQSTQYPDYTTTYSHQGYEQYPAHEATYIEEYNQHPSHYSAFGREYKTSGQVEYVPEIHVPTKSYNQNTQGYKNSYQEKQSYHNYNNHGHNYRVEYVPEVHVLTARYNPNTHGHYKNRYPEKQSYHNYGHSKTRYPEEHYGSL